MKQRLDKFNSDINALQNLAQSITQALNDIKAIVDQNEDVKAFGGDIKSDAEAVRRRLMKLKSDINKLANGKVSLR